MTEHLREDQIKKLLPAVTGRFTVPRSAYYTITYPDGSTETKLLKNGQTYNFTSVHSAHEVALVDDEPSETSDIEQQALKLWEGMFGQATTAKGGGYTVEYKTFIERIVLFANGQKRKGFDQNVSEQISEMQIVDIAKLLGAIIYKTVMKDTGAKDAEFKLKGFSVDGEMLGTLKISAQLEPSKRGQDGL